MEWRSWLRLDIQGDSFEETTYLRRLNLLWLLALVGWAGSLPYHLLMGRWRSAALPALCFCLLFALRRWQLSGRPSFGQLSFGFHAGLAFHYLAMVAASMWSGQGHSTILWFFCLPPLVAAYQEGIASAMGWTVASLVSIVLVHVAEWTMKFSSEYVATGVELMVAHCVLVLVVLVFAIASRRITSQYIVLLREHSEIIQTQAEELQDHARVLARARDAALLASQAKSEFLANVSHELRNPLNSIIGTTDLLLQSPLPSSERQLVETLQKGGAMLLAVLEDVLDLSKIEAGKMELEIAPFSLHTCVDDILSLFATQAQQQGLRVFSTLEAVPEALLGDHIRVRQILINLVSNAIKFTPEGEVELRACWSDGEGLRMSVRDTGIGIPQEQRERLFDPFEQVEPGTTRMYGGTGLGLAICERLVRQMGGRIWIEEAEPHGSLFQVALPLERAEALPAQDRDEPAPAQALAGLSVLVVEDSLLNRHVLEKMLQKLGVQELSFAKDGQEAVERVEAGPVDAILMDVHLPRLDGPQATRKIRELPAEGQPWIIALTANVTPEQRLACRLAGMDDFLGKPLKLSSLSAALHRALAPDGGLGQPYCPDFPTAMASLWELCSQNWEQFSALVRRFQSNTTQTIAEIDAALASGQTESVVRAAHGLKSTAAMYGSAELRACCERLEQAAARAEIEACAPISEALQLAFHQVSALLDDEIQQRRPPDVL